MTIIKMAIVGAGTWGRTHAEIFNNHPNVELVSVCDLNLSSAQSLANEYGVPPSNIFSDHQEMLESIEIDAVSIVTPDFSHSKIAIDSANAGKNIIIEKPLATNREEALAVINTVKHNKVRMMVDLHSRWNPLFTTLKDSITQGEIGETYNAYLRLNDIKEVATDLLPWASKSSILWFLGYHAVDLLMWLFDDKVERVYSVSRTGILKIVGVDTVDIYQTILEFKNGGIATLENGWITPNTNPNINDIKLNVTGTKGMFNIDPTHSQLIERFTETKADKPDVFVRNSVYGEPKGFAHESIRHFIDKLISHQDFFVSMDDAYNATVVILAIKKSAKIRQPVLVEY